MSLYPHFFKTLVKPSDGVLVANYSLLVYRGLVAHSDHVVRNCLQRHLDFSVLCYLLSKLIFGNRKISPAQGQFVPVPSNLLGQFGVSTFKSGYPVRLDSRFGSVSSGLMLCSKQLIL